MATGSLRQRAPILPVTMPTSDCDSGDDKPSQQRRPLPAWSPREQQSYLQQRRRRRHSRWERQFLFRTIFVNAMCCIGFLLAVALWTSRSSYPKPPSLRFPMRLMPSLSSSIPLEQSFGKTTHHDFVCKSNPRIKGILNDDYCDCPDGSDEPHTSACSNILVGQKVYSCGKPVSKQTNHNYLSGDDANRDKVDVSESMMLFASRIRDGVVDCPNAADELT